jgi:hypothetical protein
MIQRKEIFIKKACIIIICFFILGCTTTKKQTAYNLLSDSRVVFASGAIAKNYLKTEDIFLQNLSAFDKSARLNTSREINNSEFIYFISEQVRDWAKDEEEKISNIMRQISAALSGYNMAFPEEIIFVKTTGLEEGNAAYCRGSNIIVLPVDYVNLSADRLYNTILHELFHIYSRNNANIQEALYEILSFKKSGELKLPDEIFRWKITDPDAAVNEYYFLSEISGNEYQLMPVLLSSSNYDERKGGDLFDYLGLYFIAVVDNGYNMVPLVENNRYLMFTLRQVTNYIQLVGSNTDYIIHPEEILATNFVFLINKTGNLPNMEIIEKMEAILKAQ